MYMWLVLQEHGRGKVYLYNIQDSNIMYIRLEHSNSNDNSNRSFIFYLRV